MFDHARADAVAVNAFQVEGEEGWYYVKNGFVNEVYPSQAHETKQACLEAQLARERTDLKRKVQQIAALENKLAKLAREQASS